LELAPEEAGGLAMRIGQGLMAVVALGLGAMGVLAAEMVGLRGSTTQFATQIDTTVDGKAVPMTLTGLAMRTKLIVNVYAIGSYVQSGAGVKKEDLAGADVPKRLHIVMERDVAGPTMADAFHTHIRANYPEPAFNTEISFLVEQMKATNLRKGDVILLTHIPGTGLMANITGKGEFIVKNPKFSKAVWDIYLGEHNLGEQIKTNMTNRL
jgi:hypothetical protein